jgi:hypothetical protein
MHWRGKSYPSANPTLDFGSNANVPIELSKEEAAMARGCVERHGPIGAVLIATHFAMEDLEHRRRRGERFGLNALLYRAIKLLQSNTDELADIRRHQMEFDARPPRQGAKTVSLAHVEDRIERVFSQEGTTDYPTGVWTVRTVHGRTLNVRAGSTKQDGDAWYEVE